MITLEITLLWTAMSLYLITATTAWIALLWEKESLLRWVTAGLLLALAVHALPLVERWLRIGHGPYINALEVLSGSVWIGSATLALAGFRKPDLRWIAAPVLSVCVLLMGWAVLSSPEIQPLPPTFKSIWLVVHILGAKLAFAAILTASGIAVVYLLRERKMKLATRNPAAERTMPTADPVANLSALDRLSQRLVSFGFIFIAFMVAAGSIWARNAWGNYWSWDPLETWSLLTWIAYGLALHLRITFGVHGRAWAWTVIALLALTVFSLFIAALVSTTAHVEFMVQ